MRVTRGTNRRKAKHTEGWGGGNRWKEANVSITSMSEEFHLLRCPQLGREEFTGSMEGLESTRWLERPPGKALPVAVRSRLFSILTS